MLVLHVQRQNKREVCLLVSLCEMISTDITYSTVEFLCPHSPLLERRKFPAARMNV